MATHSSVLAWRIPGMAEPGGVLSMGSHRVGLDWSDLAAASEHLLKWKKKKEESLGLQASKNSFQRRPSPSQLFLSSLLNLNSTEQQNLYIKFIREQTAHLFLTVVGFDCLPYIWFRNTFGPTLLRWHRYLIDNHNAFLFLNFFFAFV